MSNNTFEKAQESFKRYQRFKDPEDVNQWSISLRDIVNVKEALELGKKQDKLLELYKKFFDKLDLELRIDTYVIFDGEITDEEFLVSNFEETYFNSEDLIGLFKQIKELENGSEIQTKQHL